MTLAITWAKKNKACTEAIKWIETQGSITIDEAWDRCLNPQWMLWALTHVKHDQDPNRVYRLLACDFAERALLRERSVGREPDPRSWAAVAVSRAFANGLATVEELKAAREAAYTTEAAALETREAAYTAESAELETRDAAWATARAAKIATVWAAWAVTEAAWHAAEAAGEAKEKEAAWQCDAIRIAFAPVRWA